MASFSGGQGVVSVFLFPRRPPRSPLFPYTTLFRSVDAAEHDGVLEAGMGAEGERVAMDLHRELAGRRHDQGADRSEEHTSELQSPDHLVCRLLLEKKKKADGSTTPSRRCD